MTDTTTETLEIKDQLRGPIAEVIANLRKLQKTYPNADIDVTTENSYGDTFPSATLTYTREKTAVEADLDEWNRKASRLDALRREQGAFLTNKVPYPREEEIEALRKELGFFAMAPMSGMLRIYNDEVVVMDLTRGGRRRDGTFVFRIMGTFDDASVEKMYAKIDKQYETA